MQTELHKELSPTARRLRAERCERLARMGARPKPVIAPKPQPAPVPVTEHEILAFHAIPTIDQIKRAVSRYYQVRVVDMEGHRRHATIMLPRHVAMHLCCTLTRHSFPAIAREFGGRDHTTVMNATKRITKKMSEIGADIAKLTESIKNAAHLEIPDRPAIISWVSKPWTEEDLLLLRQMRAAGRPMLDICYALGRTREAISTKEYRLNKASRESCAAEPPTHNLPHGKSYSEHSGSSA